MNLWVITPDIFIFFILILIKVDFVAWGCKVENKIISSLLRNLRSKKFSTLTDLVPGPWDKFIIKRWSEAESFTIFVKFTTPIIRLL